MEKKIVAPCGIDCFNCELYKENVTNEMQSRISDATQIPKEMITCVGCANGNQCLFIELEGKKCRTLECVEKKGVDYCFQCDTFPCSFLMPLADGAERFPQNIKLYNLCLMKKIGVEEWVKQAADIRKTYFTKKIKIGEGGSE
ncbi:DUF3795 domain-containing protein [Marinisporobacter balticus]|uniref:Uncharacterized protein DUF3795 n=1 Tax=Marinisporobacter balticus TaxID=2018667 RepID=A0A4V2S9Q4_9FIRM|nr:DUF3795 domain-containing protein [Marinisporobacter balticus]TCO67890.1 uncharacterized protein DUF3795 [Marinisporobacter balticus]